MRKEGKCYIYYLNKIYLIWAKCSFFFRISHHNPVFFCILYKYGFLGSALLRSPLSLLSAKWLKESQVWCFNRMGKSFRSFVLEKFSCGESKSLEFKILYQNLEREKSQVGFIMSSISVCLNFSLVLMF